MRSLYLYCSIILSLLLASCDLIVLGSGSRLQYVQIKSPENFQEDCAVTVDIIAIFDSELAKKMKNMKAAQYFHEIEELQALNSHSMSIWRIEQLPNTDSGIMLLQWKDKQCKPIAMMIFADYRGKGTHQATINNKTYKLSIDLGTKKITNINEDKKISSQKNVMKILQVKQKVRSTNLVYAEEKK